VVSKERDLLPRDRTHLSRSRLEDFACQSEAIPRLHRWVEGDQSSLGGQRSPKRPDGKRTFWSALGGCPDALAGPPTHSAQQYGQIEAVLLANGARRPKKGRGLSGKEKTLMNALGR